MTKRDHDSPPNKLKGKLNKYIGEKAYTFLHLFLTHSAEDIPEFLNKEKEHLMIEVS